MTEEFPADSYPETAFPESSPTELLTDTEVFSRIWFEPRRVFRFITGTLYEKHLFLLAFLAGVAANFSQAEQKNMGDSGDLAAIVGYCVIFGGLFGWLGLLLVAWLVRITGRWLGGVGVTRDIFRNQVYASLPAIAALIPLAIRLSLYGNEVFKEQGDTVSKGWLVNLVFLTCGFISFMMAIWSFVMNLNAIAGAHRFGRWKAFFSLVLAVLLLLAGVLLIAVFFRTLFSLFR